MTVRTEDDPAPSEVEYTVDGPTPDVVFQTIARNLEYLDGVDVIGRREPVRRSSDSNSRCGELLAVFEEPSVTPWSLEYKPHGPHGALAMLVGAVFALPSFFLTLLLVGVGYALYRVEREGAVPLLTRTRVRVTVRGAESTEPATVTATCTTGVVVDVDSLADLEWPLRRAVVDRVREASVQLPSSAGSESFEKTFFRYLNAWRIRSPSADVELVETMQAGCLEDEESWRAYRDTLLEWAPPSVRDRLDERRCDVRSDLVGVFEDVDDELR